MHVHQIELLCKHIRGSMLKHHTLEVHKAFYTTKKKPTHLNKEYTQDEHHCLHKKITHTIRIQVQMHKEGSWSLCINIIWSSCGHKF